MSDNPGSKTGYNQASARGAAQSVTEYKYNHGDAVPSLGVKIEEVLFNAGEICIFIDENVNLQWCFDVQPVDSAWVYARVAELESKCEFFKSKGLFPPRLKQSLGKSIGTRFMDHHRSAKRFIGQGVVILYTGGTRAEAEAAFANAEAFIVERGRETSLLWLYLSFGLLALFSLFVLMRVILKTNDTQTHIVWSTLACAAAGGIGAYISRALASRSDLPCDANAGKHLHYQEALLRWSVGVVAGGLVCLLVKGKVLLGSLEFGANGFPVVLALATLAGMSERFLPTLLNRFDDQVADSGGKKVPPPQTDEQKKATLRQIALEKQRTAEAARTEAETATQAVKDAQAALGAAEAADRITAEEALRNAMTAEKNAKEAAFRAEQAALVAQKST